VESWVGCGLQSTVQRDSASLIQQTLGLEHLHLGGLQDGVQQPFDAHRQDDVGVLAALEKIAQHLIGDAPDEGSDLAGGDGVNGLRVQSSRSTPPHPTVLKPG
jgi:hypothetical protein